MILKQLSLVKLHGALTLDVEFNDPVTLLIGINGSGKTSALDVIDVLLRPDMRKLATLNYESLALTLDEKGTRYVLSAQKTEKRVTIAISGGSKEYKPITIDLMKNIDPEDDEATNAAYSDLGPEEHERPMWDLLKSFAKPTVIALDRTISAESDDRKYLDAQNVGTQRRLRLRSPLARVHEVTSGKFAEYRLKAIANDDELKAQIVMAALQESNVFPQSGPVKPMTKKAITKLEEKIVTYLSRTIKSGDVAAQVKNFFRSSMLVSQRHRVPKHQHDLLLDFVAARYQQVENLAKAFNDYETKNDVAFNSLRNYLVTVNAFFSDSKKELYFDESTGRLVFAFVAAGVRTHLARPISHLSSGERQLLILFTFLAFASNPDSVFIVDEPELSLHPKWQHEFLGAFIKLRPPSAQLLLATHSPDIVGKFKSTCVTLRARVQ
jgi:predicted ATP-dependent endonuclease of OLD family